MTHLSRLHLNQIRNAVRLALLGVYCTAASTPADAQPVLPPAVSALPSNVTEVTGVWIDHTGRGAVEIVSCGEQLCGYIYWTKDTISRQGKPLVDAKNPDSVRRNKPICGTRILANLVRQGPARLGYVWGKGTIYDPEEGETFDAEIKLTNPNELSVFGYAGVRFLGETYSWKRAPADLVRCGPPRV